jgi:RNA polymerase sigma-70 factor (ECF subfamily)
VFESAAKTAASDSGRISASVRSLGRNAYRAAMTIGDALTIAPDGHDAQICHSSHKYLPALVGARHRNARGGPGVTGLSRTRFWYVLTVWTESRSWPWSSACAPATRPRSTPSTAAFNARLYGFLARLARSRDVAEDLLEDTWLRFVTHADQLRPDTRLGPWLFTVARQRPRDVVPGARGGLARHGHPGSLAVAVPFDSPFERTAGNELERRIEAALGALPVEAREVLLLVGMEGLTPSEAAAVCGVTPEAMRQRLKRARAQLRARLTTEPRTVARLREAES